MGASNRRASLYDEVVRFNADRLPKLVELKFEKMSGSAFAFFRGTDHLFARAWQDLQPPDAGPPVLCCGDLHLENFGAYQTVEGDFRFDINDFDEALAAPCSFDLVRCSCSTLLAAEEWRLSPLQATGIALAYLNHYREALLESASTGIAGEIAPGSSSGPVQELLSETARGSRKDFLDKFTDKGKHGQRRQLRIDHKHPAVPEQVARPIREAVEAYGRKTPNPSAFEVLGVSGRLAGIGSLGVPRYLVLIEGEGSPDRNRLLDVKQVRTSSVAACAVGPQSVWTDEADRVVSAQLKLQAKPALGLAPLSVDGVPYRIREMIPEESRAKLDRLQKKPAELRSAVQTAGELTSWSHWRGCDPVHRAPLADWVTGAGIDSVLAAAVRFADRTEQEYQEFLEAWARRGAVDDKAKVSSG
ncbi:MAG TPA: DUF2252 family protein [Planctomycetaceae bacterium]|nr:DUF2252 family protein [Planctomycetaceae bacterium]